MSTYIRAVSDPFQQKSVRWKKSRNGGKRWLKRDERRNEGNRKGYRERKTQKRLARDRCDEVGLEKNAGRTRRSEAGDERRMHPARPNSRPRNVVLFILAIGACSA